jgi:hypothetical protein
MAREWADDSTNGGVDWSGAVRETDVMGGCFHPWRAENARCDGCGLAPALSGSRREDRSELSEPAAVEIVDRLVDLVHGVHHERAVVHEGLVDGGAAQEHHRRLFR